VRCARFKMSLELRRGMRWALLSWLAPPVLFCLLGSIEKTASLIARGYSSSVIFNKIVALLVFGGFEIFKISTYWILPTVFVWCMIMAFWPEMDWRCLTSWVGISALFITTVVITHKFALSTLFDPNPFGLAFLYYFVLMAPRLIFKNMRPGRPYSGTIQAS